MMGCWNLLGTLLLCLSSTARPEANAPAGPSADETAGATIALTDCKVTDKNLHVRYEIRNDSDRDIWICERMDLWSAWDVEVYVGQDNQTLFVQRRLDVPMDGRRDQPLGRYARVPRGQTRTEVLSLGLPVHHQRVLFGVRGWQPLERATRVIIEIGYYEGNLPATVFQLLEEAERTAPERRLTLPVYDKGLRGMIGGTLDFNSSNQRVRTREEQVIIPWTDRALPGEKVLRLTVEDLAVPYSAEDEERKAIHVTPCRRIDIRFRGSPLRFYFPHPQEQSLLSPNEREQVESLKSFVVVDPWDIMYIASAANDATTGVFRTDHSAAELTCYRKDGSVLSLAVYDDSYIVTQDGQVFRCDNGLRRLRELAPLVKALDLRMECAANLKDLWYCLRLYPIARHAPRDHKEYWDRYLNHGYTISPDALRAGKKTYPTVAEWCDVLATSYRGRSETGAIAGLSQQVCPGAGEGKCHYAMNPSCRFDSPADMVLLFETKAGWNQHGGPELFRSGNHNPRGGCVVLNDGTVRFLRTEDELRRLRWK